MARASASSAISAMRLISAFDRRAFVATTAIVVLPPGRAPAGARPMAPLRICVRTSASPLPSSVRIPATTLPVDGSTTSPAAFTATMAPTIRPLGSAMLAEPSPPFMARPAPPILPTVAPAPAPTLPSGTAPFDAVVAAL